LAAIGLTGCGNCSYYKEGTVINESGTAIRVDESLFGSEKLSAPTYTLQIKTADGIYTASVKSRGNDAKTIEALALAINEGDRVRFEVTNFKNKAGTVYTDEIDIIPKE
jgi:hypothetical protein